VGALPSISVVKVAAVSTLCCRHVSAAPVSWTPQQAPVFLTVLSVLLVAGGAFTAVAFITWLYQARENLDLRREIGMRWAKGWTIGGWFVPIADLVIPARVVAEVVARSRPGTVRSWTMPRLVTWWWIAFLLGQEPASAGWRSSTYESPCGRNPSRA
jgi:Domain of unknown function (DUF4328)